MLSTAWHGKTVATERPQPYVLQPCEHRGAPSWLWDCSFQNIFRTADRAAASSSAGDGVLRAAGLETAWPSGGSPRPQTVESPVVVFVTTSAFGEVQPGGHQQGLRVPTSSLPLPGCVTWGRGFKLPVPLFPYLENRDNHLHPGVIVRII